MEVKFISTTRLTEFLSKVKTWANSTFAVLSHTHTKSQITDLPVIPTGVNITTVNSITAVGSLPVLTFTPNATTGNLTIAWSQGSLPTKGSDTTVVTGLTYNAQDIWDGGDY